MGTYNTLRAKLTCPHCLETEELAVECKFEIYRFLWLRTFHHPIAVAAVALEGGAQLRFVELDGRGG